MKLSVEYTDTFAGQANYSWVKRLHVKAASDNRHAIVRAAKAAIGLTGVRCEVFDYGDMIEIRPRNMCAVALITPADQD
jgi:hypothetical protein